MSVRKLRVTLKPRTRQDALLYTCEQWGEEQRRRYRARLYDGMRRLVDYPELGPARDDLYPGCRSFHIEQHVIFYEVTETEIVVGRVLHVRQDAAGKVKP